MPKEATREQMVEWLRHDVREWVRAVDEGNQESAVEWFEMAKIMAEGLLGKEMVLEDEQFDEGNYYLFEGGKFNPEAYVMVGHPLQLDSEEAKNE